ncbi:hypothetical protein Q5Y75_21810 [Ruegeria sp. 2205SS24-7]|uniref:trypsin-like serine peptidase n=1 Tax=Ruegeria discodermiae TaxID=3064389 RepID=UPI0027411474|nr:hypothetical protein [Ruegeria sp. 2205SS24-7]MDP5219858.1 hypothetical protein [Ruegeria sp. 2205SS24-7]
MLEYEFDTLDELDDFDEFQDSDLWLGDYQAPPPAPAPSPNLVPVANTRSVPYRWVCKILVKYPRSDLNFPVAGSPIRGEWLAGTGVLISSRHILTAGHNVRAVKGSKRYKPTEIHIVPAQVPAGDLAASAPFGVWRSSAKQTHVPAGLFDSNRDKARLFDYALIRVSRKNFKSLGKIRIPGKKEKFGWFGSNAGDSVKKFTNLFGDTIAHRNVNVAGFPKMAGGVRQMRRGFNLIDAVRPPLGPGGARAPLLRYRISAQSGLSGAPIWLKESNGKRKLIAIHSGRVGGNSFGLLIRSTVLSFLAQHGVPADELRVT